VDLDIKGFFDNIDHALLMKAIEHFKFEPWVTLYIDRWLKAPTVDPNGQEKAREKGTPQGGVISPLLANIFLHFAFDLWLNREIPNVTFERYADDIIVHCKTRRQAEYVKRRIMDRLLACGLEAHPEKTKIIYCKDENRSQEVNYSTGFNFLGFEFRRRSARGKGKVFDGYLPALSLKKRQAIQAKIKSWRLHRLTTKSLRDLANMFNPFIRGWYNYYGHFYISALNPIYWQLQKYLTRWAEAKYKRFRNRRKWAYEWLLTMMSRQPTLFAHWACRNRKFCERSRAV
jgi:group II intron reverse transcriptase/maturase